MNDNAAQRHGGAFYLFAGTVSVEDCIAVDNTAVPGTLGYRRLGGAPTAYNTLGDTSQLRGSTETGP